MSQDKTLEPPTQATIDRDRGTTRFWFNHETSLAPTGHYQVAGGICWPKLVGDVFKGCAVIGARNTDTGIIYIFDQREFTSIGHVIGSDGNLKSIGLAPWFVQNWAKYYCYRYYWFQCDEYNKSFRLRVGRSDLIEPRPSLIQTHWGHDDHVELIIADALAQQKLKFKAGTPVHCDMQQHQADPKQGPFPARHALSCLLTGLGSKRIPDKAE